MTLIEVAKKDLGKKEKPGNSGFEDKELEKAMRAVGWVPGFAWCASILKKWVNETYPERAAEFKDIFTHSAVATYRNLVKAGYKNSLIPSVGALVFWQKMDEGKALWMGHAAMVTEVINDTTFKTIEGNTSNSGSRNGDGIYSLTRIVKSNVTDGLMVIGFIDLSSKMAPSLA